MDKNPQIAYFPRYLAS